MEASEDTASMPRRRSFVLHSTATAAVSSDLPRMPSFVKPGASSEALPHGAPAMERGTSHDADTIAMARVRTPAAGTSPVSSRRPSVTAASASASVAAAAAASLLHDRSTPADGGTRTPTRASPVQSRRPSATAALLPASAELQRLIDVVSASAPPPPTITFGTVAAVARRETVIVTPRTPHTGIDEDDASDAQQRDVDRSADMTALLEACLAADTRRARACMASGVPVHAWGISSDAEDEPMTPLQAAATGGGEELCMELLDRTADASVVDSDGNTLLHLAAGSGLTAVCRRLVDRCGARVNATNLKGATPLHWAAAGDHSATCEYLMSAGAEVKGLVQHRKR